MKRYMAARMFLVYFAVQLFMLGRVGPALAANYTFTQDDWTGGVTSNTAVHPDNMSEWNQYKDKDTYIYTDSANKVIQTEESLSVIDTADTDFQKTGSERDKVDVSGSGSAASLVLQNTLDDPFTTNLSQWTSLPEVPHLDWWSAYVRVVDPRDSKVYIYAFWTNKTFARFSAENETWEILSDTLSPFGFGAALAYPSGSGDYIYALRGGGTKDFWRYSISTDTWVKMPSDAVFKYSVGAGGSLAAYGSNSIYCVVGNNSRKFLVYSISAGTWTELSDVNNTTVDRQGALIYPGTGEYLYVINNGGNVYSTRYKVTLPTGWTNLTNAPAYLGDACYPGTGNYIYAWPIDDWNRRMLRLDFTATTPVWEEISATARLPVYPYRSIMYYPGTGTKLKWLNAGNYSQGFTYDPANVKWDDLSCWGLYNFGNGSEMVYDGSNYIYATRGDDNTTIWRYSISANTSESRTALSSGMYNGGSMAYLGGYIYYTRGASSTTFGRFDTANNTCALLTAAPETVGYGGALCAVGSYIYAFRGNTSVKFWRYDPTGAGGVYWDDNAVADAPATVADGGSLVYPGDDDDGTFIYATRGASSKTFWRYCISPTNGSYTADTWYALNDCPFILAYKSRLLYPGSGDYVYLMTGFRQQFARYKFKGASSGTWEILEPTPFYQDYYYGACAIGDTIYAGYQTDRNIYTYTISTGLWSRRSLDTYSPYYGSIVSTGGDSVYMFYGNYTSHFWKYSLSQKRWVQLLRAKAPAGSNEIIFGPGTKACYPGSNGQAGSENYIYVLEGRNTDRFWKYDYVNDTWTALSGPVYSSAPLRFYSGSQLDGSGDVIYACQGRDITNATEERSYKFLKYTVSTDTWEVSVPASSFPDLPTYIRNNYETGNKLLYVPSQSRVYWAGYEDGTLRYYDISAHTWNTITAPGYTIRLRGGSCLYYNAADNSIFWISGQDYRKTYKYSIDTAAWTELLSHGRCFNYSGYDADMMYPGSGDLLYLTDGYMPYMTRYSLTGNDWDILSTFVSSSMTYNYTVFSGGPDGNNLYIGAYNLFYRYDPTSRTWTSLVSPYNTTDLAWRWDEWNPQLVYYAGDKDSLFTTKGRNNTQFAKYSISANAWSACLSPGTFGNGHCLVATQYKIYALLGGSTTTFKSYNPAIPAAGWTDEITFPDTVSAGAAMVYVPSEDTIYATRGNNTASFYKFNISNPQWTQLEDAPVALRGDPGGSSLVYPGSGDYIYLVPGPVYSYWGETCAMFRFSLSLQKWDTADLQALPEGIRGTGKIVYPGKGNYLYLTRGYGAYDMLKYLLFKQGTYTSEVKNVGRNKNYGTVTWTDTGNGAFEFKARTSDNQTMSGAVDWDNVSLITKGKLLSDLYPAVQNRHQYLQYQMKFYADDLNKLPTLNDLTINYAKYRTKQEIVSTPYDSTQGYNRLMKLSWDETQPTGTEVRMQLRTGATKDALLDANNHFLGPGGTQTFNYDFSTDGDYAHAVTVEVSDGTAHLTKILQDYLYTQRIVLDNSAGTVSYTNSAVKITIDSSNNHFWANVKSDGGDIRFVDQDGNLLSYNCTSGMGSWDYVNKSANILVKVSSIPAGSKTAIYLKYGKSDAESASDPTVTGKKLSSVAGYDSGDSGDYSNGTRPVAIQTGLTYDDTVSGYSSTGWNSDILTRDVIFLYGRTNAEDVTALNNGSIVVLNINEYNSLKAFLSITSDLTYTSQGYTVKYFSYSKGYVLGCVETTIMGCDWEHYSTAQIQSRGLNIRDAICNLPNAGVDGSDIYLGLTVLPIYCSLYQDKATSTSLSGWEYRHEIEIDNRQGATLTNYQVKVTLAKDHEDFWSRCMSSGYDVRFVDSDNTTIMTYYRIDFDYDNKTANFWVKVPSIAAGEVKRIYLYYGKSDAADVSSYNNTFVKDFGDKGYNTSALNLDGVDDKITVNHSSSLNLTGNFTLESNLKYTADTWFPGFGYRKKITLTNSGLALTNTAVQISVSYVSGKMNADYSDIRFEDTDGTKLSYRIKSYDASSATVYVVVPSIPASSTKDIYIYYGNTSATSESDTSMIAMPGTGLVGWWAFNEGTGSTAYDLSGNNNNGALQNGAYFTTGKNGGGLGLDGTNDQVYVTNSASLQVSGSMSICFWLKPTTVGSGRRNPIHKEYAREFSFTMENGGASGTSYYHGWGSGYYGVSGGFSSSSVINGTWTHFAFVRNNTTRTWTSYKNGVVDTTGTWTSAQDPTAGTSPVLIGSGYAGYVGGVMDDVVIYNRALTVEEIQQTFSATTTYVVLSAAFDSEESQPAIDQTIIKKSGAYELRFTQSGLTGFLNGSAIISTVAYDTGRFMHVALSYDGSYAKLYVNGTEEASVSASGAVTGNANNVIIADLAKGAVDEVRIWSIARKPGSIMEDKEKYLDGTETGLKCYLRLNENTGASAADSSGNANAGTIEGSATWLAPSFSYSNGKPSVLYHMDEGTGTTTADSSGNGLTLSLSTDITWSATDLTGFSTGKSVNMGVSNVVATVADPGDNSVLDITGKISLEAWIRPDTNTGSRVILVKGDDSALAWNYKLYQSNDCIAFSIYSDGAERACATPAFIIAGTLYHIVATFDEDTDAVKIYVNNVEKYSGLLAYNMAANNYGLRIGKDVSAASLSYRGLIDEVRIYRRVLTAEEIRRHYEHRLLALTEPGIYNVYNPPTSTPEISSYSDNNPTIQPVLGVFYTNKNLMQFQELSDKPVNTDIKYQISRDGYWWYWFNGSAWVEVDGGYSQANTASEVNAHLGAFQDLSGFSEGDFYYRAFLHSESSSYRTPVLNNVAVTLYNTETFYYDPAGATPINTLHTDADSDRWFQYKAILYSDGETTPILEGVNIEYVNAYIHVLSPNGGQTLSAGLTTNVTWESHDIASGTGLVKIEYSIDGAPYTTVATHVANTGSYTWNIPDTPSENVLLKISSEDFPVVSDTSDAVFSILSLQVNSPNGGEVWTQSKSHNITWTATGTIPYNVLKIDYSSNNGSTWTTVNASVPNTGSYAWSVPIVTSDQVLVKVYSTYNNAIRDTSNAVFSIVPPPAFTISSPAGGEHWIVGEHHTISWRANALEFADEVILEYSLDDFVEDINPIAQVSVGTPQGSNPNDDIIGSYDWTIPDAVSGSVKVRVREASVPAGRDTQVATSKISSAFTIAEPTITLTAPVSGDIFVAGDIHNITWTSVGQISDQLLLEYSVDGQNYTEIASDESNDGTYAWTIPAGAVGDNVYVRVTDTQRTQVSSTAGPIKVFEHPVIEVIQPDGGEQLNIGTAYQIKWRSYGQKLESGGSDYNKVSIYFSVNNGTDWQVAVFQSANTGTYNWTVPDQESDQCLIKIVDESDTRAVDISSSVFRIVLPVITVVSPDGGEVWYAHGIYNITWNSVGSVSDDLLIEYSANGGSSWTTIGSGVANTGTYQWSRVSENSTSSGLIRVTDADRPVITDTSNSVFTITQPTITVTSPNGGEEYAVGTSQEITWESVGKDYGAISDDISIQYSTNGGSSWIDVDAHLQNSGSYVWGSIPDTISATCKVKIFDASRTATSDISNENFKIVLPYIRVTSPNGNEQWPMGTHKNITWTCVGAVSNSLLIEYSKDNFAHTVTIAADAPNTGTYDWLVNEDYSTNVKIRITDNANSEIVDVSDLAFTIAYPIITVTAPNGGELWTIGDDENITWTNTGSVGSMVDIQYSTDNFVNDTRWITEPSTGVSNTGSYTWTLPVDAPTSSTVRVKVTDRSRTTVSDKSDMSFTILPRPVITIDAPNGGEIWRVGTAHNITWHDNGGRIHNNLTIQYSYDSGTTWNTVATGVSNSGSYTWESIPDHAADTARCLVKIFDADRTVTVDTSDELFQIAEPTITVTSPNGGEVWAVGDTAPVTWTSEGTVSDNLILEWTPNGGTTWYSVSSNVVNDGSFTWTVPDDFPSTSNAYFRITDGNRPQVYDVSNQPFKIIPIPTITVTNPTGGQEHVLGDTVDITWTYEGLGISNNLLIEISNDNFVSSRQIIAQGVANTGRYEWVLTGSTLTGATLKIRITDGSRTDIKALSSGYFRIRGGFTVLSPNGGEYWVAKSSQTITWQTRGSVSRVKLEYSSDGLNWNVITASASNNDSYSWVLPDIKSSTVLVRVSDPDDPTTTDSSDAVFQIVYSTVTFKVLDYDTLQHLEDFNVSEPSTSWADSGMTSPITRTETYPYGTYTTFFSKTNYIDNSVTWNPPKSGTTPYIVTVYLENSASAQVTWESIFTYSYSPGDDTLNGVGSLQRKGKLVGTTELERADMGPATLIVYEPDSTTIRKTLTCSAPSTSGMYSFTYAETGFEVGKVYPATLTIEYRSRDYTSSANIDVGSEKLQYEFFTKTAAELSSSVEEIKTAVGEGTAAMQRDLAATKNEITAETGKILAATGTASLPDQITQTQEKIETSMKSEILNRENYVRSGQELTIRYRTYSGLSPKIDVYDASNKQRIIKGAMTEIGTTGIYEYDVTFSSAWGMGDFSVVCSEDTKGTLDALVISVLRTDLEQIAGDISGVLGTTAGISSLKTVADSLNSQFSIIETALSKVGKDLIGQVRDATGSATALESVHSQLSNVAKQIQGIVGESGVNLQKLFDVSEQKKEDITYLKNKTQQLKAAMEINTKLIDNIANKPVTQTWYEYE